MHHLPKAMQYRQAMCRIPTVSLRDYTVHPLKQNFNISNRNVGLSSSKSRKFLNFSLKLAPKERITLSDF